MPDYRLTAEARADLRAIARYGIDRFGALQANHYAENLEAAFARISANPLSYQSVNDLRPGYRRAVYQSHAIYFRTDADGVLIVRILGQQDAAGSLPG